MYEDLMEEAVEPDHVGRALKAVERNRGAAGIDRMETSHLRSHLERHWESIRSKLLLGTYTPAPVRRVEIPKPNGEKRKLGIPTVLDRLIQQLLFASDDADLRGAVQRLKLWIPPGTQCPRCGTPSPLLANIYLDTLDQELEKRGHCFVRYADDCNVYAGGRAAANHHLLHLPKWIQSHLRLEVNASKSGAGRPWERKFLGFRITKKGQIEVSPESLSRCKVRVRELWRSCQSLTNHPLREQWQRFIRGWWNYYRLAEYRRPVYKLEGWVRRHIRKFYWLRWHDWKGRRKALQRLGVGPGQIRGAHSSQGAWRMAKHPVMQTALRNATLLRHQFWMPSDLARA